MYRIPLMIVMLVIMPGGDSMAEIEGIPPDLWMPTPFLAAEHMQTNDVELNSDATGKYLLAILSDPFNPLADRVIRMDITGGTVQFPEFEDPVDIYLGSLDYPHRFTTDQSSSEPVYYIADSKNDRVVGIDATGEETWTSEGWLEMHYPNYVSLLGNGEAVFGGTREFVKVDLESRAVLEQTPYFAFYRLHGMMEFKNGVYAFESDSLQLWKLRWDGEIERKYDLSSLNNPRCGQLDRNRNSVVISHSHGITEYDLSTADIINTFPNPSRDIGAYGFRIYPSLNIILLCSAGWGITCIDRDSYEEFWSITFAKDEYSIPSSLRDAADEAELLEILTSMGYIRE